MITTGIFFKNFDLKKNTSIVKKKLNFIFKKNDSLVQSLGRNYKDSFNKKDLKKFDKFKKLRLIGMGGSSLGAHAIYDFLKKNIKKKFTFVDNLRPLNKKKRDRFLNIIVSKSGNTLETIINSNLFINKKDQNVFIIENNKNYLYKLAEKLKAKVVHHNNFIGGRYSVLSEVGMLPAELMGLNPNKFRQLNHLMTNQKYLNALVSNVSATLYLLKKKKI